MLTPMRSTSTGCLKESGFLLRVKRRLTRVRGHGNAVSLAFGPGVR